MSFNRNAYDGRVNEGPYLKPVGDIRSLIGYGRALQEMAAVHGIHNVIPGPITVGLSAARAEVSDGDEYSPDPLLRVTAAVGDSDTGDRPH